MSGAMPASMGLIRAEARRREGLWKRAADAPKLPFVTIARQVGAGGETLAQELADRLNGPSSDQPVWRPYDRELVEQIARDHNLSQTLIDLLEDTSHSWLQQIFECLDFSRPSEQTLTRRVIETIRSLAEAGHAIIVGRGSVFITHEMPQGVHIRLVAPLSHRIERYAERTKLTHDQAARRVKEIDKNRENFYARNFPKQRFEPAAFHLTINTAKITSALAAQMIVELPVVQKV